MGWIWTSKKAENADLSRSLEPVQHTRIQNNHNRAKRAIEAKNAAALEARKMASQSLMARRPMTPPTPVPDDAPISVSVLHRALPERFST